MRELAAIGTRSRESIGFWARSGRGRPFRERTAGPRDAQDRCATVLNTMPRLVVALACAASAFQAPVSQPARSTLARHAEDPTKVWYADLANGVQNLLQNSPLNEDKKAVVKMMAGGYDVQATNAKLDELIANPVVMLSFTK